MHGNPIFSLWIPIAFVLKDLSVPRGLNLAHKLVYLAGTVLN